VSVRRKQNLKSIEIRSYDEFGCRAQLNGYKIKTEAAMYKPYILKIEQNFISTYLSSAFVYMNLTIFFFSVQNFKTCISVRSDYLK
jgi:hypothetical protein